MFGAPRWYEKKENEKKKRTPAHMEENIRKKW